MTITIFLKIMGLAMLEYVQINNRLMHACMHDVSDLMSFPHVHADRCWTRTSTTWGRT
jgi:hypothetical protein